MDRAFTTYRHSVPKKTILVVLGTVWIIAGFFLFGKGFSFMLDNSRHLLFHLLIGITIGIFFFIIATYKISRKDIARIITINSDKPFSLDLSDITGYFLIILIICTNVLLFKINYINEISLNIFYCAIGFSLFLASLLFFYSLLTFRKLINKWSLAEG